MVNISTDYAVCKDLHVHLIQSYGYHLTCAIMLIILSIVSTLLNVIFLYTSSQYRFKKSLSDYLYIMLAVTDILTSTIVMPIYAAHLYRLAVHNKIFCTLWIIGKTAGYIFGVWSAATITTITVELFLAVAHPYYHESSLTVKKVIGVLTIVWVTTTFLIVIARISGHRIWHYFKVMIAFLTIPIACSMFIMHCKTYFAIKQMGLRCKNQTLDFKIMLKSKQKLLRTAIYILLTFIICFLPMGIISIYILFAPHNPEIDSFVLPVTESFVLSNSFFDPFVYYFRLKRIREITKRIFCCKKHKSHSIFPGGTTTDRIPME